MAQHGDVNLGDLVKDAVTGFEGIAISATTWLNGCRRIGIQSRVLDKEGRVQGTEVFDEIQLTILERGVVVGNNSAPQPVAGSTGNERTGGPLRDEARLLSRP